MTQLPENFERYVCEIHNRFEGARDFEESWNIAQRLVLDLGGTALNAAVTSPAGNEITWARSSMSQEWLETYLAKKYHLIDPFLHALQSGIPEIMVDCGTLESSDPAYSLNHDLKFYGYGSLFATSLGSMTSAARSLVVFCSDASLSQINDSIGFDRLRVVHAIMAGYILMPDNVTGPGFLNIRERSLTQRECNILSWLASGLRNDEIAFKENIAEVTVRMRLLSIRKKLGAKTREQAIAIAVRDGWVSV